MKTTAALLAAAAALAGVSAQAGYRDLSRELDAYEPPALYRSQVGGKPGTDVRPGSPASDDEFRAQIARLREVESRWEKALTEPTAEDSFYTPAASQLEVLRPAATDATAAEKALADGFSLETLEALTLLRSPAVRSKERELRAALAGYSQVENLDSILRQYTIFTASLMAGVGSAENPDAPALKFPFPGVLALKGEIVTQDARAAREGVEAARRDAVTAVRKAYWELLYARAAQEITGGMLDLLDNLKSAASARYSAGETTFQDVVKIGIEREKAKEELKTLGEEQRNREAEIREVLSLPPVVAIGAPAARAPNRAAVKEKGLYPEAKAKRQELRAMRAMIGRMERMLEMAETMIYPGFSLNLSLYERDEVSRIGAGAAMGEAAGSFPVVTTASMGAGLPKMPWFGKDDAYLRETRQRIGALQKDLEMTEASTALSVREAWFRLDKALREEALFGDRVVSLSQAALEASTRGYRAGKVMFSDLIESYTGWLQANLALERAKADTGVARAELEAVVGATLP
ncbi:MAG: TolC family protein [Deltaproteobacteria bacterium]|nr:TolC family protein [Deltaproteobacteria bacterium]